jgi:hypothetical protein
MESRSQSDIIQELRRLGDLLEDALRRIDVLTEQTEDNPPSLTPQLSTSSAGDPEGRLRKMRKTHKQRKQSSKKTRERRRKQHH